MGSKRRPCFFLFAWAFAAKSLYIRAVASSGIFNQMRVCFLSTSPPASLLLQAAAGRSSALPCHRTGYLPSLGHGGQRVLLTGNCTVWMNNAVSGVTSIRFDARQPASHVLKCCLLL